MGSYNCSIGWHMTFLPIFKLWWMTSRICLKMESMKSDPLRTHTNLWFYIWYRIRDITLTQSKSGINVMCKYLLYICIRTYRILRCWMPIFIFDSVNYTYINHTCVVCRMKSTFNNPSFSTKPFDGAYTINYSSIYTYHAKWQVPHRKEYFLVCTRVSVTLSLLNCSMCYVTQIRPD